MPRSEHALKVGVYHWPGRLRRWFADCGCGWHAKRRITKLHAKRDARHHSDTARHNCRWPLAVK